jgi:GntR family transcriptional regulator, transcriptional repressor for pyruvate dehydrogenase complex
MELFREIKRISVSKEIMIQIKESILSGKIKSGDKIPSERELTERFNVSRNMVREAIRGLEMTGYLDVRQGPQGGAFVKEFTHERLSKVFLDFYLAEKLSVKDLNQARLHLEPEVARLAAKNIDSRSRLILMEAMEKEYFADNLEERMRSLTSVHCVLAGICGNFFYEIMVNSLISISHEIILNTFKKSDPILHGLRQHNQIVEAVLEKDPERAAKAMTDHLKKFADAFINFDKKYKRKSAAD